MNIIHSGFDTISFAVKGALDGKAIETLKLAKTFAAKENRDVAAELGRAQIPVLVKGLGVKGGYAFVVSTGQLGQIFQFKNNLGRSEWNGFVKIRACGLAVDGWRHSIDKALEVLEAIGFTRTGISMNRADYCMDFLNAPMKLDPSHFIAHARVKKSVEYRDSPERELHKQANFRSDVTESITLGKMPGRQVTIYDKRREAIEKRNFYWFEIWDVDRHDPAQTIHRVELRAGKDELKKFGIVTLEDFEAKIGNVMNKAVRAVRYITPSAHDKNISRQALAPLWQSVTKHVNTALLAFTSDIDPEIILEVHRDTKTQEYKQHVMGNIAGLGVCLDVALEDIPEYISALLREELGAAVKQEGSSFIKTYARARERLRFIAPQN